jgi:hypothetical protein
VFEAFGKDLHGPLVNVWRNWGLEAVGKCDFHVGHKGYGGASLPQIKCDCIVEYYNGGQARPSAKDINFAAIYAGFMRP